MHEAHADDAFVAKHAQKPAAIQRGVRQFAVVEQARARVGSAGEPVHERGQEDRLQLRLARGALNQRVEVVVGAGGVAVAQRGQLRLDRVGGEGRLADGQVYDGLQQRAVEEALVQVGHHLAQLRQRPLHLLDRGAARGGVKPGGAGEPAQPLLVVRVGQLVGPLEALQLQAVLQESEELVGADEFARVFAADVAAVAKRFERRDRVGVAQVGVDAPVHKLQQLHGELHVAQAPLPQLQLALPQRLGHVGQHAPPHRLHVLHEGFALGGLPHERSKLIHIALPQLQRPRQRPRLEQGLELPRLGPPLVVRHVAVQGAHERAGLALGAQVAVHLEEAGGAQLHELAGGAGRLGGGVVGDEDDVHVGDVVQLAGAALAHGDDGEPRVRFLVAVDVADGDGEGGG